MFFFIIIIQVAKGQLTKEQGRLGPGTDVWAMALSLLYCLCGYHVMVYACTGDTMYRETDPQKLQAKRIQCVFQVGTRVCIVFLCALCTEKVCGFFCPKSGVLTRTMLKLYKSRIDLILLLVCSGQQSVVYFSIHRLLSTRKGLKTSKCFSPATRTMKYQNYHALGLRF